MREQFLKFLCCPECRGIVLRSHSFQSKNGDIESGLVVCNSCRNWYPVIDSIPVVSASPMLTDQIKQEIRARWADAYDFSNLRDFQAVPDIEATSKTHREQIKFYDHEVSRYDSEITDTVFWQSLAKQTIQKWGATEKARTGMTLEIGCGTGASTIALAKLGCKIVALDICLAAVKVARVKVRDLKLAQSVDFIVSEAEALPFRPELFQSCIFSGALHHVSDPILVLKQISGVLSNGGAIYGHENNASAFRFIFDLLMKMKQLWHEEAGTQPLMRAAEVEHWGRQAGLRLRTESTVFLPPHLFNLLPPQITQAVMSFTNRLFGFIPWLRNQGGLLIISGTKQQVIGS